tara:strand:- start:947 stop:1378 length:432 start_codon:yes stop_codon:yes gene_type:complete
MLNLFKKKIVEEKATQSAFEVELVGSVLAYEIARADGDISELESNLLIEEIKKISKKVNKDEEEILQLIELYSKDSVSFYEFIEDINKDFDKENKLSLVSFLWEVAYADSRLDVNEERLIRRIADLIRIKDIEVLKLKNKAKK